MNKPSKSLKMGKTIQFISHINFTLFIYFITKNIKAPKIYIFLTIPSILYFLIQKTFSKLYKSLKKNTTKNTLDKKHQSEKYYGTLFKKNKNCQFCKIEKIPRSHHCNECGICVYLPEFHSFYLGGCITEKEKILYLRFIFFYFIFYLECLFFILYVFFFYFENEILDQGFDGVFESGEGYKIMKIIHSENWRFFIFFVLYFYLASFSFFNFVSAMKICSFRMKNFERKLFEKKMEKFSEEIEYMNLYINNYDIDRDDKNDLRENILYYSRWRINYYSLYNKKNDSVFSLLKKIFYL